MNGANEPDPESNAVDYISMLNADCLIKIFDELAFVDLMSLCKVNDWYCQIIKENVIGKRTLDLGQIRKTHSIEKLFE